jgi:hypothetical protein
MLGWGTEGVEKVFIVYLYCVFSLTGHKTWYFQIILGTNMEDFFPMFWGQIWKIFPPCFGDKYGRFFPHVLGTNIQLFSNYVYGVSFQVGVLSLLVFFSFFVPIVGRTIKAED